MFGLNTFGYEPAASAPAAALGPQPYVVPSGCCFLSSIPFDSAIVTANHEVATLPASFLQYPEPEMKWRSTTNSGRIVVQFPAARACTGLAVIAHNGEAAATYRLQGGPSEDSVSGIVTPSFDSGFVSMWPTSGKPTDAEEIDGYPSLSSLMIVGNTNAYIWWSIEFNDSTNVDPFEAGRIMLGEVFYPSISPGAQIGLQVGSKSQQRTGDFNRTYTEVRGPASRKMVIPFPMVTKDEFRRQFFNFQMRHTNAKDFFFTLNPNATDDFLMYSMQALFSESTAFQRVLAYDSVGGMWTGNLTLLEMT